MESVSVILDGDFLERTATIICAQGGKNSVLFSVEDKKQLKREDNLTRLIIDLEEVD